MKRSFGVSLIQRLSSQSARSCGHSRSGRTRTWLRRRCFLERLSGLPPGGRDGKSRRLRAVAIIAAKRRIAAIVSTEVLFPLTPA